MGCTASLARLAPAALLCRRGQHVYGRGCAEEDCVFIARQLLALRFHVDDGHAIRTEPGTLLFRRCARSGSRRRQLVCIRQQPSTRLLRRRLAQPARQRGLHDRRAQRQVGQRSLYGPLQDEESRLPQGGLQQYTSTLANTLVQSGLSNIARALIPTFWVTWFD